MLCRFWYGSPFLFHLRLDVSYCISYMLLNLLGIEYIGLEFCKWCINMESGRHFIPIFHFLFEKRKVEK